MSVSLSANQPVALRNRSTTVIPTMGDHSHMQTDPQSGDPGESIVAKMKAIFETDEKPLTVAPVVVEGDWAIAGWIQDGSWRSCTAEENGRRLEHSPLQRRWP